MEVREGKMSECIGNQRTIHQSNPLIRLEAGLSNCMGNKEPLGLPQEAHVTDPPPLYKRVINIEINT
jgi:hypothetical protein